MSWKNSQIMKSLKLLSIFITLSLLSCTSVESVPVLIIGGGASGVSAGIQSSRMGVEAMIIEETPWLGGMLTSAGVSCIDGNYQMRSGIFGELTDSLAARYGGYTALQTGWVSNINFDPHIGQEVFTNMTEACSDLLTVHRNSSVLSIRKENESWTVAFLDAEGRKRKVQAEVLIDATELGDVAKECGVDYRIGMESSADTGESIAPAQANDVIQDLTYVAFLKDYGPDADMTIDRPEGYDPSLFADSCLNPLSDGVAETGQTVWSPEMMITYGKTPGGRYMINWPIYGNDFYTNIIDASNEERDAAFQQAKNFTLCFVYFIQTQLGMKNLGLADAADTDILNSSADGKITPNVYFNGNGTSNINQMYRINPQLIYNIGKMNVGLEYQWTAVQYGEYYGGGAMNSYGLADQNLHWVGNNRVNMMVKFNF